MGEAAVLDTGTATEAAAPRNGEHRSSASKMLAFDSVIKRPIQFSRPPLFLMA
jgi:hypothetical protein